MRSPAILVFDYHRLCCTTDEHLPIMDTLFVHHHITSLLNAVRAVPGSTFAHMWYIALAHCFLVLNASPFEQRGFASCYRFP